MKVGDWRRDSKWSVQKFEVRLLCLHSVKHLTPRFQGFNPVRKPISDCSTWMYSTPHHGALEVIPMDTVIAASVALCSQFTYEYMDTVRQKEVRNRFNFVYLIYKMWCVPQAHKHLRHFSALSCHLGWTSVFPNSMMKTATAYARFD